MQLRTLSHVDALKIRNTCLRHAKICKVRLQWNLSGVSLFGRAATRDHVTRKFNFRTQRTRSLAVPLAPPPASPSNARLLWETMLNLEFTMLNLVLLMPLDGSPEMSSDGVNEILIFPSSVGSIHIYHIVPSHVKLSFDVTRYCKKECYRY